MATEIKVHLLKVRPGVFGGELRGTLCNRLRVLDDGMNLTDKPEEVTCHFCKQAIAAQEKRAA